MAIIVKTHSISTVHTHQLIYLVPCNGCKFRSLSIPRLLVSLLGCFGVRQNCAQFLAKYGFVVTESPFDVKLNIKENRKYCLTSLPVQDIRQHYIDDFFFPINEIRGG